MPVITIIKEITANKIIADKGKEVKRQMIAISKPPATLGFIAIIGTLVCLYQTMVWAFCFWIVQ